MIKVSDLRMLEVINITDGRKMGPIKDVELDPNTGSVRALVITGEGRILSMFGRSEDFILPWEAVKKIGFDVILIEMLKESYKLK